jgi:hypothetical protein
MVFEHSRKKPRLDIGLKTVSYLKLTYVIRFYFEMALVLAPLFKTEIKRWILRGCQRRKDDKTRESILRRLVWVKSVINEAVLQ